MQFGKRLEKLPPYRFAEIDRKWNEMVSQGIDIINMGGGNPNQPTPAHIVQARHDAINDPATHKYLLSSDRRWWLSIKIDET
jgi:LL-diaminopimelate aminotransferase